MDFNPSTWGTVAEWFGAVGTVGAVIFAIFLWRADQRRQRRAARDAFVSWFVRGHSMPRSGERQHFLEVYVHNTGSTPVPMALVQSRGKDLDHVRTTALNGGDRRYDIPPDVQASVTISLPAPALSMTHILEFKDATGKTWYRNIVTGKYMPDKQAQLLLHPPIAEKDKGKYRDPAAE